MSHLKTPEFTYFNTKLYPKVLLRSRVLQLILLTGITGFATLLRIYKLGAWSFWIDEVYNINYAKSLWTHFSINQPSLMLISLFLRNTEINQFTARLIPALIGILTIPLLYFPIRKMFGNGVALFSVFLIAISPWHLHWSQNSRFYSALLLFYALSVFIFYFALEEDKPAYFVLSIFFLGLAFLERKIAGFWVPVMVLYMVALPFLKFGRPAGFSRRNLILLTTPVILFGMYEVIVVAFAGRDPFFMGFVRNIVGYQHNPMRVLLSVIYDMGLPLFLAALLGGVFLLWKKSRAGLFLVINAILPLVVLVVFSPFVQSFSRYVFLTLPAWTVLASVAVVELFHFVQREGFLLALVGLVILVVDPLSQDVLYYQYQNGNRPDWSGAFQVVEEGLQPGDVVFTTRVVIGEYYLGQNEPVLWTQGLDPQKVEESGQRSWFVIDNRTGFVSSKLEKWLLTVPRLEAVKDVYIPGKTMMMRVYLYDPAHP